MKGNMHYKDLVKTLYSLSVSLKQKLNRLKAQKSYFDRVCIDEHPNFQVSHIRIANFEITALDFKDAYIES